MKRILFVLVAIVASCMSANSQEAFKHLSAGLELGSTGAGVEVALPVVSNHVVVKLGYNFPGQSISKGMSMDVSDINSQIEDVNRRLSDAGAPERINTRFSQMNAEGTATIDLRSAKLMVELYPFKKSSFHFVFGAYMGMGDFLTAEANTGSQFWGEFKALKSEVAALDATYGIGTIENPKFNVGDKTYALVEKNGAGYLSARLGVEKIRPYAGIGFGRSIPDTRLGVQLDLGAWIHGTPSIISDNEVSFDASAENIIPDEYSQYVDMLGKLNFYPQLSLRIIYKIF